MHSPLLIPLCQSRVCYACRAISAASDQCHCIELGALVGTRLHVVADRREGTRGHRNSGAGEEDLLEQPADDGWWRVVVGGG